MASERAQILARMQRSRTRTGKSEPAQPAGNAPRIAETVNAYDYAMANRRLRQYAAENRGLDGVPLQRGQSPVTAPAPRGREARISEGGGRG